MKRDLYEIMQVMAVSIIPYLLILLATHINASHNIAVGELANHNHTFQRQQWYSADTVRNSSTGTIYSWKSTTGGTTSASYNGSVEANGSNQKHNNIQPYHIVYSYKRTK